MMLILSSMSHQHVTYSGRHVMQNGDVHLTTDATFARCIAYNLNTPTHPSLYCQNARNPEPEKTQWNT